MDLEIKYINGMWMLCIAFSVSQEYSVLFGFFDRSIPSQPGRKTGQWCNVS